ncbi:MAG: glycosyltransferase family 4 protein [Rhizobiaceae bacterium]
MDAPAATREAVVFDISLLALHGGHAVGIIRVMRELARWARANRTDVAFVFFDRALGVFRRIMPEHLDDIVAGRALIDMSRLPDPGRSRRTLPERLPSALRGLGYWLRSPRRQAVVALERARLAGRARRAWTEPFVRRLLSARETVELVGPDGGRRMLLPFDLAAGEPYDFGPEDTLLYAGSDWSARTCEAVAALKALSGLRVAFVSYDVIPLKSPHFFVADRAAAFKAMFDAVIAMTDVVMVTARSVAADIAGYCEAHGMVAPQARLFLPGSDLVDAGVAPTVLPFGLQAGRYALFVSTIEPRKGHRLLFDAWKRLETEGVPRRSDFRLVFVGRRGWMVDALMADIEAHPSFGSSLLVLSSVDDHELHALYQGAAFTLFPSRDEGYGLPVVESFRHGKAVLASSAGALPEVIGDFSPQLDPRDEDAWLAALRRWIEDPAARAPYEAALARHYRHPGWAEAAATFFAVLASDAEPAAARFEGTG